MRTSWRQPWMLLFLCSSVLLIALVVWWEIFFIQRIDELKQGEFARLEVQALEWIANDYSPLVFPNVPPDGLILLERDETVPNAPFIIEGADDGHHPEPIVSIDPGRLAQIEAKYDRKRVMILTEGSVLLLLVLVSLGLLAANLRRAMVMQWEMGNFVQSVTHELKSPLTSLKLLLETLQQKPEAITDRQGVLAAGLGQIERLERLINNILKASALEGHRLKLAPAAFDLALEVRRFVKDHEPAVRAAGGQLTYEAPRPVIIRFDADALRTILDNLLDNALKYSRDTLEVHLAVGGDDVNATLAFTDRGVGLEPGQEQRLFERFWRAGDELTRESEGTGLGLYLCRRLMEQGGGSIRASSPGPGEGTTMHLSWPRGQNSDLVPTREIIPDGG